jgi:hypothetical protein
MENSASIGMAKPVFGHLRLRKYHTNSFEANSTGTINYLHESQSQQNTLKSSWQPHVSAESNPLSTNIFLTENSLHEIPPNDEYKRDLIIAQRELMNAHEEILKLEAELRAARFK